MPGGGPCQGNLPLADKGGKPGFVSAGQGGGPPPAAERWGRKREEWMWKGALEPGDLAFWD